MHGLRLATGSNDNSVKIWGVRPRGKLDELITLRGHKSDVSSVAWSPDGTRLLTASASVKIWDAPGYDSARAER